MIVQPLLIKKSKIATARLAPCKGSVPFPTSSKSTKERSSHSLQIVDIFEMCEEKVDKLFSMD